MGVSYLIDTHILLWWLFNDSKLSAECQNIIRNPDNRIIVSSVSAWEIATKYRIGKLPEAKQIVEEYSQILHQAKFGQILASRESKKAAAATETIDNPKLNIPKL
jgi:PIN domain nuclease of toxin-antitoxin system